MNGKEGKLPGPAAHVPLPAVPGHGSGEGADTALEALIRKRRTVAKPEPAEPKLPTEQPPA